MERHVLPYSCTFHPTLTDAEITRWILKQKVPTELATLTLSFGYNPWLVKRRVHERNYNAAYSRPEADASVAGLYLSTDRLPTDRGKVIPRRIIFQTSAADQGWATFGGDGTFHNSHTWFEASILRPLGPDTGGNSGDSTLEDALPNLWWDTMSARDALNEKGWDFVEREDGQITWRVCNNMTARRNYRSYRVEWRRGIETEVEDERAVGKGEGFLELLEPGYITILWARAEQRYWVNKVEAATIEIEYELL